MSDRDTLAEIIRRTVAQAEGYWWYDGGQDGELPEALAADLIKAGWRAPFCFCCGGPIDGRACRCGAPDQCRPR